jgi:omega-hydroxy-beta-dihydromenaquinone-9 sulfotransferase
MRISPPSVRAAADSAASAHALAGHVSRNAAGPTGGPRQPSRPDLATGRRYAPRNGIKLVPPATKASPSRSRFSWWHEWAAPFWIGCNFPAWTSLLIRNRFAVHWSRWHFVVLYTLLSVVNSCLGICQKILFGRRVAETVIADPPIFIVGHWRSGTTMLHELLDLDDRHTGPTTYECIAPHHFLLTERFAGCAGFLGSTHRAMDNMAMSVHHPQEDEFALCMLGQPSPYRTVAFPNRPPQDERYFALEQLTSRELKAWKQTLFRFVQQVYFRRRKAVVLKSPTHSFRIKVLLDMFPQARFVHIVRDPYVVYPSTMHLHESFARVHGLQRPTFEGLDEKVLSTYVDLHRKLDEGRELVDPSRFYELRYEDLIADPEGQMRRLYDSLELGGFEQYRPRLRQYLADHATYKTNTYNNLTAEERAVIADRWGEVIDRYGYGGHAGLPSREAALATA